MQNMNPQDRQDIKDAVFMAGTLLGLIARRTKTPVDDKLGKALLAISMSPDLLDKFIDIVDTAVPA